MNSILLSALEVNIVIVLTYLCYTIFLRKEKTHRLNRFFIMFGIIVAFIIPFISIPLKISSSYIAESTLYTYIIDPITVTPKYLKPSANIITTIYKAGIAITALLFIFKLLSVIKVIRSGKRKDIGNYHNVIVSNRAKYAFSFFNNIVLPESVIKSCSINSIILHEKTHIKQKHSYDIILLELISILLWYNPFIWVLKRSVKTVHEYLADEGVINAGVTSDRYRLSIIEQTPIGRMLAITQNFNSLKLKKRIIMMNKKKSTTRANLKALIMVPTFFVACMVTSATLHAQSSTETPTDNIEITAAKKSTANIDKSENDIFNIVEEMPTFQKKDLHHFKNWVMKSLVYPPKAIKDGTQGTVYVTFVIEKDGSLSNIEIQRGISLQCDNEVKRVIAKSPKWKPGKDKGKTVRVKFSIPVKFTLS